MIDHLWFYLLIATAAVIDTLLFSFTTYMEWKRYRSHPKPPKPTGQQPLPSVSADPMTDRWVPKSRVPYEALFALDGKCFLRDLHRTGEYRVCPNCSLVDSTWQPDHKRTGCATTHWLDRI